MNCFQMVANPTPRLLIVSTTPGPSKALAEVALTLRDRALIGVLSSKNARFGQGDGVYRDFGIGVMSVEGILPQYQPMAVTQEQADELLTRLRPEILLAGAVNEPTGLLRPLEDAVYEAAASRGMRNFQFIEGWDVWHPRQWGSPQAGTYLVTDNYAGAVLQSEGVPPDRIRITGYSPSLMVPNQVDLKERSRIRMELGIADTQRLVAYFGQVACDNPTTLGWTSEAMDPDDRLIFQKHPRDVRPLDRLMAACPAGSVMVSDLPSTRILHAADVCVTHFSLMSFTAAGLGIPSILILLADDVLRIRRICGQYPTTLLGGTVECHNLEGLRRALNECRRPAPGFIDHVRRSTALFAEKVATALLDRHSHAA